MGIVVQKYGGSSVADAEGVKRVAQRIVDAKRAGNDVVVVVSAMGDTTDELIDLAEQVSPIPAPRELDMLLTAGERISMALLAMAVGNLGHEARSFTGSQAGVITDSSHGKAKIIDVTPGRIERGARRGRDRDRRRLPGRQPGHQGHHHARPRRLGHHRGRAGRGTARRRLRDLHRRRRRVHRRPADRADRPEAGPHLLRGDARDGRLRREDPAPAVRRVRPPLRHPDPRALVVQQADRHLDRRPKHRGRRTWNRPSSPASPTTGARPRSPSSACPTRSARPRASSRRSPTRRSTST